jgi:hypothetical protein
MVVLSPVLRRPLVAREVFERGIGQIGSKKHEKEDQERVSG